MLLHDPMSASNFHLDKAVLAEARNSIADSKYTIAAAFLVKQAKSFSLGHGGAREKTRILCITTHQDPKLKAKVVTIKRKSLQEAAQIRDSWKLKTIESATVPASKGDPHYNLKLNFGGFVAETFHFESADARSAFLGALLYYNQQTYAKKFECVNFQQRGCLVFWKQLSASDDHAEARSKAQVGEEPANAAFDEEERLGTARQEADLEAYILECGYSMHDLKGFDGYLQDQLAELDASNVQAILTSVGDVDKVICKVNDTLEYVDDIEEWLNVFNTKLQHMRVDISAIEERNNALQIRSDNITGLVRELRNLETSLELDAHAVQVLTLGGFHTPDHVAASIEAAQTLNRLLTLLEGPSESEGWDDGGKVPFKLFGMRAVKERKSELNRVKNQWTSRARAFLIEVFNLRADDAIQIISQIGDLSAYKLRRRLEEAISAFQGACCNYTDLIECVLSLDSSMGRNLSKHYAKAASRLVRGYTRLIFSEPKAVLSQLQHSGLVGKGANKGKGKGKGKGEGKGEGKLPQGGPQSWTRCLGTSQGDPCTGWIAREQTRRSPSSS